MADNGKNGTAAVGGLGISAEDVAQLARLVEENGLSELRLEDGDLRVTLRTGSYRDAFGPTMMVPSVASAPVPEVAMAAMPLSEAVGRVGASSASANLLQIEAPIMGVFYRSAAPSEPALVEVGDAVEIGQPVGVIEAMKVFSEVLADHAGRVHSIPAKNGGLVQPGEPLIVLGAL